MNTSKLQQHDVEIERRYLSGESARSIAKSLGSCDSAVSYRLKILGIKKRTISEASKGHSKSETHKRNLSTSRIVSGVAKGERNPRWKGGVQDDWSELKNSIEYKLWRDAVLIRDNYTCRACGCRKGKFDIHHILQRAKFPHLKFCIDNGIVLCKPCHRKTFGKEHLFVATLQKTVNSGKPSSTVEMAIPSQAGGIVSAGRV